jgi:putative iron-dependent peroxidase
MNTRARWQPLILDAIPEVGRFLEFDLRESADPRDALLRLAAATHPDHVVVGAGLPLVVALGATIPGLRAFPTLRGAGRMFPSTQNALWLFVAGSSDGELFDRARSAYLAVSDSFAVRQETSTFRYRGGRDLSGYEDGTENPVGDDAVAAAIVSSSVPGLDGATFVAVQRWRHDLTGFSALSENARDNAIGRSMITNKELAHAPSSAHVKRAAQESFSPPAHIVRRSMPWGGVAEHGLYFAAYGESLDRFERILTRISGVEDGVVDGLLTLSRAESGGYYFCPPLRDGMLDWTALGL